MKILGSVGHPLKRTEIKVVNADTDEVLSPGSKGIIKVRGPQVMTGYFKVYLCIQHYNILEQKRFRIIYICLFSLMISLQNPSATRQVLDDNGWLNTGDLGWISPCHSSGRSRLCGGVLVLEGRAKDTIVLSTGNSRTDSPITFDKFFFLIPWGNSCKRWYVSLQQS